MTPWGCAWPCIRMPVAWVRWFGKGKEAVKAPSKGSAVVDGGKVWQWGKAGLYKMVGFLPNPKNLGPCGFCLPIPLKLIPVPVRPQSIENGMGEVTMTVMYHREGGEVVEKPGKLSFWKTRYPDVITSQATARYTAASVGSFGSLPQARAFAELVATPR